MIEVFSNRDVFLEKVLIEKKEVILATSQEYILKTKPDIAKIDDIFGFQTASIQTAAGIFANAKTAIASGEITPLSIHGGKELLTFTVSESGKEAIKEFVQGEMFGQTRVTISWPKTLP